MYFKKLGMAVLYSGIFLCVSYVMYMVLKPAFTYLNISEGYIVLPVFAFLIFLLLLFAIRSHRDDDFKDYALTLDGSKFSFSDELKKIIRSKEFKNEQLAALTFSLFAVAVEAIFCKAATAGTEKINQAVFAVSVFAIYEILCFAGDILITVMMRKKWHRTDMKLRESFKAKNYGEKMDGKETVLETERIILRPWRDSDAEMLYMYAKNDKVGPIAGWPVHTSVENSLEIIHGVLSAPETYAVVLKGTDKPVGSVGIMRKEAGSAPMSDTEAEIGYWIGEPFWGQGLIPEAVKKLLERCFTKLGCTGVWCGYYENNGKSKRVTEKCGFRYHHTEKDKMSPLGDIRTEIFTFMTKNDWENCGKL